jgi:hypothetical protein
MKAFQAYGKPGRVTSEQSPRAAAVAYFEKYPASTKCTIVQGETDGYFFTVRYGRASVGEWPNQWKDITKKTAQSLPAETDPLKKD